MQVNWPSINQKKHRNLILKQFIYKNYSYQCACGCALSCFTIQLRTFLVIFPLILHTIVIVQICCLVEGKGTAY